jgi:hypothetical protein
VPVDGWTSHVGELDAWINEGGRWLGRVWHPDGRVSFLDQADIRPMTGDAPASAGGEQGAP